MTATPSSTERVPVAGRARELATTKRRGRTTPRQQRSLERLWPRYGVEVAAEGEPWRLDRRALFGREAPVVLEVGFGMGEATVAMAAADPGRDVLAVDLHVPGAGALLHELDARGLANVRVLQADARRVLREGLAPGSLDEVRAFFPDPWPKARHRKRRLVDPAFAALVADRLAVGGRLHVATDWVPYAEQVVEVLAAEPRLEVLPGRDRPAHRPLTRFERQGLAKGHVVTDVVAVQVRAE
ncbi:tRNA (guanosine(46)-N7)-methyltransferase TrmB [Vallicoccus soli]|uniref:tRNA (guanine-N(7)-)-methyltransferase n=1 Tax=Vallicoccus soli TaxID=2339232 RepID=A0A3A3Z328_9ACTN|nr:tRNA (guanosine(46)-N7)-methyltransferase TrmB [Vallicoccus soli]RJK97114.1 tRNA (guanosine(46)-N7)-methyltransferase TrmB [Vallicoccus soli]